MGKKFLNFSKKVTLKIIGKHSYFNKQWTGVSRFFDHLLPFLVTTECLEEAPRRDFPKLERDSKAFIADFPIDIGVCRNGHYTNRAVYIVNMRYKVVITVYPLMDGK